MSQNAEAQTPSSKHIELGNGIRYHYLEWGRNSAKTTVIFIHGFLDNAWSWQPVVEKGLSEKFHVIAPDMRGHGDSGRVGAGGYYHFLDYIADIKLLAREVTREDLALVGHSMGGTIASYFAGAFPKDISKLALFEGLGPPEDNKAISERVSKWPMSWAEGRTREPRRYPDVKAAADRLRLYDKRLSEPEALWAAGHGTKTLEDGSVVFKHDPLHLTRGPYPFRLETAEEFWKDIICPVLLLDAADSNFSYSSEESRRRLKLFKESKRCTIEGAGHMMHRHQPGAVAGALLDFL